VRAMLLTVPGGRPASGAAVHHAHARRSPSGRAAVRAAISAARVRTAFPVPGSRPTSLPMNVGQGGAAGCVPGL